MKIYKSIIATILFIIFITVIGLWVIIEKVMKNPDLIIDYYIIITGLIEFLIVAIFINKLDGYREIFSQKTSYNYYVWAFVLGVLFIFIRTPLDLFYNLIFNTNYKTIYDFKNQFFTLNSLGIVLLFPIAEELFFRQYIQKRLQINYKHYVAIGVSALLFASIHLKVESLSLDTFRLNIHKAYITFFGGISSGILYYKSKSIGPPITFHIMWNLMARII